MPTTTSSALVLVSRQNGIVVIPSPTPLTRLNYFDGKFLRASDLKAEQDYLRQLVAQSNQAGGAGVAHGFDLTLASGDALDIGPGLAIDPTGRVLLLPQGTTVSVQELIDKSRDLQQLFGTANSVGAGSFETCELPSSTPPVSATQVSNLYLIVISPADALCGEEDVYGRLCEEACATSTDRPFAVEGLIVRAIPLVLQTPLPAPKAVALTQTHLRSRVASAYFEDERRRVASLISKAGLEQQTWCLGADAAVGNGVPIGVIARAGSTTVFLDPWIARRERIDTPAKRYWQWRMMMRPWDVFLAQVLQFQCQLNDLFRRTPMPGGEVDPCGGAHGAISEAANTISELARFYESTTQRFKVLDVNLDEALTFSGGLSRLTALNDRLVSVSQGLAALPSDRFLINGGIVELPSAGYLPVVPGAAATINQQVRRMMGEGVDLRFCVVRPDYVAHALEEAQHMERISLLQGLDDPQHKPEVDILVPNGEVLEQKLLSPGNGFEASVDLNQMFFSPPAQQNAYLLQRQPPTINFRGAARAETLPTGGGAFYLSCDHQVNLFANVDVTSVDEDSASTLRPVEIAVTNALPAGFNVINETNATLVNPYLWNVQSGTIPYQVYQPPRLGLWISLRCDSNVFTLRRGDTANFNASAIVASSNAETPMFDIQFNGVIQITQESRTTGTAQTIQGHIENAQVSVRGDRFGNAGARVTALVDLDVTATLTGGSAIEILLDHTDNALVLSANWGKQPLEVSASIMERTPFGRGVGIPLFSLAAAKLNENVDVLSATNASHVQALAALEIIAKILKDVNFADAKARLLFPPPPKPTDELLVRGTMDWVLFHRRRTKRCSQEICVPPVAPPRHYQVYHVAVANLELLNPTRKQLIEGKLPESRLNTLPFVDFDGGGATLLTNPQAWRSDWANIHPGNSIVYAAIANRDSAAADGDVLALSRLGRLVDAVAPVSTPNAQMQTELLSQIPSSIPASSVDGVIFLFTMKVADLMISKTASPAQIVAENDITYTLTITNKGPAEAQDVTVTDPIPPNATFVSARGLGAAATEWRVNNPTQGQTGTVLFHKDALGSGDSASFEIVMKAHAPSAGGVAAVVNTATVASAIFDPNSADNTFTTNTPIVPPPNADLQLTKSVVPLTYSAATELTYTLVLRNLSTTTAAQNVVVRDPLPANTRFVSANGPTGWTVSAAAVITATGIVSFTKDTSFAANQTATFTIKVTLIPGLTLPPNVTNRATVQSTNEAGPASNIAEATSNLSRADLQITKEGSPNSVIPGGVVLYTLFLENLGPSTAQNVVVTDTLPANTTQVPTFLTPGWTSVPGPATKVVLSKSAMLLHETARFEIAVMSNANSIAQLVNRVTATSDTPGSAGSDEVVTDILQQVPVRRRKALVIFSSFDGFHRPQQTATRGNVEFVSNVPQGRALADVIHALKSGEGIKGVMLATVSPIDFGEPMRLANSVDIIANEQGRSASSYNLRTGLLTAEDKTELGRIGVLADDFDDVIYLEPNPPV